MKRNVRCWRCNTSLDPDHEPAVMFEGHAVCSDCLDSLEAQRDQDDAEARDDMHHAVDVGEAV